MLNLSTKAINTWCPGCTNFLILAAFKNVINELVNAKELNPNNLVCTTGIGCHGKIGEYLNLNSFEALHGRGISTALGMKIARPELKVVAFAGDGDAYAEGLDHLLHAAKKNSDITVIIHNNQIFALTTAQYTPTSPKGFKGRSTPYGSIEEPFNQLALVIAAGGTFIARTYSNDLKHTQEIILAAMRHPGFSLVEIIQPCITFYNIADTVKEKTYWLPADYDAGNESAAMVKAMEKSQIPLGILYNVTRPVFEDEITNSPLA